jgi:DNA-binding protein YbaB
MTTGQYEGRDGILAEIRDIRRKAHEMSLKLDQVVLQRADDQHVVIATANGFGRLLSIEIDEPVRHPQMLGAQITSAIRSCRHAARSMQDEAGQGCLPGVASLDAIRRTFRKPVEVPSFEELPGFASDGERAQIIEAVERLNRILHFNQSADRAAVSAKIASGACEVRMNVANSYIKVLVDSQMVGSQKYAHLGLLIVEAIAKLEDRCTGLRQEVLDKTRISNTSVGRLVEQALGVVDR